MFIIASTFGIGTCFASAEAPRTFSIATRIGAPFTSHRARYWTSAIGPLPIGLRPPARIQIYRVLRRIADVVALVAQVRDLRDALAALPIVMSAALIAITGGTENSHCSAAGALPCGESMVMENTPGVRRSVWDGGTLSDWPKRMTEETNTEMTNRIRDISLFSTPAGETHQPARAPLGRGQGRPIES